MGERAGHSREISSENRRDALAKSKAGGMNRRTTKLSKVSELTHLRKILSRAFHALLISGFISAALLAQSGEVSLRGQVTDQSGAVVARIPVTLSAPGGVVREAITDESEGRYVFRDLPAGTYALQVHVKGFAEIEMPNVVIVRGQPQVVNLQLDVVMEQQEVTVKEDEAPSVSLSSANNASAVTLQGADLEALSDDPTDLQADLQALAGPSAGPSGGAMFVNGFSGGNLPAKESIREIRINQNPFSPEYDTLGYGRIEIFTKPGTEKYHGTMDYNFGKDFWNSRNPYSTQKAPFMINELEGNLGGPLGKRASFAVEYQRNMVDNGSITNGVTLDPQTLTAEAFNTVLITPQRFTRINPRVDYQLNPNNTLVVAYDFTHSDIRDGGIGGFNLISQGYHVAYTDQTVQATETAVLGRNINETRFQYYRTASQMTPNSLDPETQVLGSFIGGGSQNGLSLNTENDFELQNYTSLVRNKHTVRFGVRLRGQMDSSVTRQNFNGTFTFAGGLAPELDSNNQPVLDGSGNPVLTSIKSIERYRRTLLFQQMGDSPAQIRALGGGATQFSIDTGIPNLSAHEVDAGVFAGDEWQVRSNVTLDLGLRYETQSYTHDWRDFAPRVAISWAPGGGAGKSRAKTVLRAGFGIFYTRFPLSDIVTAERYNGIVQQQFVVANPDFFPAIPSTASLEALGYQSSEAVSSRLRAPYVMQSALTLERQLSASTAFAVTYTNSRGMHLYRSEDINTPLPGTYNPNVPGSGTFPLGHAGPVFLMESSGIYNQNQIVANINTRLKQGVSLFGFYVLNRAMSNTDGIDTVPANPYNFAGEYGPAATDVRHRVTFGGSISMKWSLRISPFVIVQSGAPFDVTAGSDLYGTTLFNGRPGIATDTTKPGLIQTQYGLLDPNPSPGEIILGRNYGRGPSQVRVNLRVAKAIGIGPVTGRAADARPTVSAGGATAAQASGRGLGGIIGAPKTVHRYNMIVSMSIQNLLNHNNPGPITGDITSPLFGSANRIAGGPNGEGFFETADNRRLEAQLRFAF
jgi:Carboxypeptidase regulatory-like domain